MTVPPKALIGTEEIYNRHTKGFEKADVYENIDAGHLDQFANDWWPLIQKRFKDFASILEADAGNVQDARWKWDELVAGTGNRLDIETYAIECAGGLQGLMKVKTTLLGRLPEQSGAELVYVDRLASAPWNRIKFSPNPKYRGVGEVLLATAVSLSIDLEFKGRLGLHALPESESYYRDIGMVDLGPDLKYENLRYFEMTEQTATKFINGRQS